MKFRDHDQRTSTYKQVALWALQIFTAAAFLLAGYGSLSGYPMMVETFEKIGFGQWFRYVTGALEITSAILLLIPRVAPIGAALLVCTMSGAVLSHLLLIGGSPLPAAVMLCCSTTILWGRRRGLKALPQKLFALSPSADRRTNSATSTSIAH